MMGSVLGIAHVPTIAFGFDALNRSSKIKNIAVGNNQKLKQNLNLNLK